MTAHLNPPPPPPPPPSSSSELKSLDDIAQQLQGYDPQSLSIDKARAFITALCERLSGEFFTRVDAIETIPLERALGRTLSQDIYSPMNVPAHTNSAMDGYAFHWRELKSSNEPKPNQAQPSHHTPFQVVHTVLAGKAWEGVLEEGQCAKIMTGAVMPKGSDTVAPLELVKEIQSETGAIGEVLINTHLFRPGDNQRLSGEDLRYGELALAKGSTLHSASMGLLASLGLSHVQVWRRPRVAIFSTGSEVLPLGTPFKDGHVYDANRLSLTGLLQGMGAEIIDLGVIKDDPQALKGAFLNAQQRADIIITSGGVSVGEADYTKAIMKELGEVAFWRIAMRPGRPFALGRLGSCLLFGLPGNPVAVMVTFLALVRPVVQRLSGQAPSEPEVLWAKSGMDIRKKPGRTEYQRGLSHLDANGQLCVELTGNQGSGILSSMVQGNCLIVLEHDQADVKAGDLIKIWPLKSLI